jgi:hypothetical protein
MEIPRCFFYLLKNRCQIYLSNIWILETNLNVGAEGSENIVDLILESTRQHLISLIEDKHLNVIWLEDTTGNHVKDTSGGA